jgi:hypothetical protein
MKKSDTTELSKIESNYSKKIKILRARIENNFRFIKNKFKSLKKSFKKSNN